MIDTTRTPRFYPGSDEAAPLTPLARYLPPLPPGMAASWLAENLPPGSWVLDPLGASPALALEAARAGYRVLVASNNPVISFLIETLAAAPESADFQSVLAELAAARRGGITKGDEQRLEAHIRGLYETPCASCGETVEAEAFLWRKGDKQPSARLYHCPKCGDSGEKPVSQADIDTLEAMGGDKLQRSRALQRVILNEDEHRADVEEALESYLARPLYVLFTLLNRSEGLGLPPERLRLLHALLISAFDLGSSLWSYPGGRARPKLLSTPPQFRENNLWQAIEAAVAEWAHQPSRIQVTRWPTQPLQLGSKDHPTGGICLFRGRVKTLMPLPADIGPRAVLTVFPRPNQAFWTLSVLWAGWLWGSEAALPLRNVLDRRRYDWNWHTSAVHSALAAVSWSLPRDTPFFGVLPELVPGFLSAVVVASEAGGFHLHGLACRSEEELAQILWTPQAAGGPPMAEDEAGTPLPDEEGSIPGEPETDRPALWERIAREAMRDDLLSRAEPAPYLVEYAAGLSALARTGAIPRSLNSIPGDLLTRVHAVLARTFADRSFLKLYSTSRTAPARSNQNTQSRSTGTSAEEERGAWWLANLPPGDFSLPLADRIEMEVVRFLQKHPAAPYDELEQALCSQFSGLLTPSGDLLRACLDSYAEPIPTQPGAWRLRPGESAPARKNDLQEIGALLEETGRMLGYQVGERDNAVTWTEPANSPGVPAWIFYRMASSIVSRYVLAGNPRGGIPVIVLPGSRARLLGFKLRRDPRLAEFCQPWTFLKFRHLRELTSRQLNRETWRAALAEDPLTDDATQMALFANP